MTRILPRLGTCLFTPRSPARVRVRGLRRRRADLVLGRRVGQADDRAQLRVDGLQLVQEAEARAAEEQRAATDRAVGVLRAEHRRADVVQPRGPEQVALVVAGRVVGQRVEQVVGRLQDRGEAGRQRREVAGGRAQDLHRRLRVAREGPQLLLDDRRRGLQEGPRLLQRRAERAGAGTQAAERRAEHPAELVGLGDGLVGLGQRAGQQLQRLAELGVLVGEGLEDGVGGVDERRELLVLGADRAHQLLEVVDRARDVLTAHRQRPGDLQDVAVGRLDAPERRRQVLAVAAQRLPAAGDEELQVAARVAVERREELVGVDVGQRLSDRDDLLLVVDRPGGLRARRQLDNHVVQAGLRTQQRGRVLVHVRVLLADLQRDDRAAVLELDLAQLADRHAGDVDRLALARRDRLRGGELRLVGDEVGPDYRDPLGQVEALVAEDERAHAERDHEDDHDGQEVPAVLADRGPHRPAPWRKGLRRSTSCAVRLSLDEDEEDAESTGSGVVVDGTVPTGVVTLGVVTAGAGVGMDFPPPSAPPVLAALRSGSRWSLHLDVWLYG